MHLVSPLDEWPRPPTFVGGGIRWTRANKPKGPAWSHANAYFEVTWSIAYKKAQEEFELVQRTHDPNLMGHFLQRYPYHIDALLQMSEVFQHHGQMDHAADCIKRCLYVLELAWADQFDVTKGACRMDITTEHNDGFFRALFLLMKQVGRRGCMRSAFETAKLLLGLDPHGDPMHVLLAIDYYALTSRQCQFLLDLHAATLEAVDRFRPADAAGGSKKSANVIKTGAKSGSDAASLSALPNLQFSLALAQYVMRAVTCLLSCVPEGDAPASLSPPCLLSASSSATRTKRRSSSRRRCSSSRACSSRCSRRSRPTRRHVRA